jgi:hypothetical protein
MSKSVQVLCWNELCNWTGRKVRRICGECRDFDTSMGCQCPSFSPCPKCGGRVNDAQWVRDWRASQEKWRLNEPAMTEVGE